MTIITKPYQNKKMTYLLTYRWNDNEIKCIWTGVKDIEEHLKKMEEDKIHNRILKAFHIKYLLESNSLSYL
jgi:hypothetical protein